MTSPDLVSGTDSGHGSAGPLLDPRDRPAAALWALFAGIGLLMVGNGLQGSVVGIGTQTEGFSAAAAGLIMAAYFVGFLAGGRLATRAVAAVGHIRVFAALTSMASASAVVHALVVHPLSWGLMRFVTGVCLAGLYVVAESWINDMATNANRGRLLAVYMVVTTGGIGLAQLLLNLPDAGQVELFIVASVLVSLSAVPITLAATSAPPVRTPAPMPARQLAAIIPTGITVAFFLGLAHGTLIGLGSVYAASVGLRPGQVALFVAAPLVGAVVFQLPIGFASDRLPRRGLMLATAVLATGCGMALLAVDDGSTLNYLALFVLGGASFPLYSLAIAYTNDWLEPEQIVGASAALVTVYSVGAVVGPLAATALTIAFGPSQFFVTLAAAHGAVVVYLVYRVTTSDAPPIDEQRAYAPFPARASAVAAQLLRPRGRRRR
ncbi:MAG: MFS transporter [Actinomycetota bacterium]